jgi:hypothetical protein
LGLCSKYERGEFFHAEQFLFDSFANSARKYKKLKFLIDSVDKIYNRIVNLPLKNKRSSNNKILFDVGVKYTSIVLKAKKHGSVEMITKGKEDRLLVHWWMGKNRQGRAGVA